MSDTYEALAAFARSAGTLYCFAFFLGVLVYALWPSNREKFNKAARCRSARTERMANYGQPRSSTRSPAQTTTGHEWDGIRELNTPLPRWWLYTFYATIAFAFVYWVFYPAWPMVSGFTPGVLGYTNRAQVAEDVAAIKAQRAETEAGLGEREPRRDRGRSQALEPCASPTARRRSPRTARRATARAGRARRATAI